MDPADPPDPSEAPPVGKHPAPPRNGVAVVFLDETNRLRTVWRFLIFGAGCFATQILAGILTLIYAVAVVLPRETLIPADKAIPWEERLVELLNDPTAELFAVASLASFVPVLALVLACRVLLDRRSIGSLGFRPARGLLASPWIGVAVGAIPILAVTAVLTMCGWLRVDAGTSPSLIMVVIAVALVLAAFVEEIIFRGYLLQNMIDIRLGTIGIVFTSVVFWIVHGLNPHVFSSPWAAVNLFGAGVALALAYLASGNIWFPTGMHFAWNFAQGPLFSIPVSGIRFEGMLALTPTEDTPDWLTGGPFGLEGSALTTLALFALIGMFLAVLVRRKCMTTNSVVVAEVIDER